MKFWSTAYERFQDPEAAYQLGKLYSTDTLGQPDEVEAKSWLQNAAKSGHAEALKDLNY